MSRRYRIVGYGPGKSCLTWSCDDELGNLKEHLKAEGYDAINIEEERDGE